MNSLATNSPGVSASEVLRHTDTRPGSPGDRVLDAPRRRPSRGGNVRDLLQGSSGSGRGWRRDEVTLHRSMPVVFRMG